MSEKDGIGLENMLEITDSLNSFLGSLQKIERKIFLRRYWYMDSIKNISEKLLMSENNIKTSLFRKRKKLKIHLEKEGIKI